MLFGETVAVYCENHTEHTDTLGGQNALWICIQKLWPLDHRGGQELIYTCK
jgi:hypothetical protein